MRSCVPLFTIHVSLLIHPFTEQILLSPGERPAIVPHPGDLPAKEKYMSLSTHKQIKKVSIDCNKCYGGNE